MPNVYATRADFFEHGLPDGILPNPGRLLAGVHVETDAFELDGHNFATGAEVSFRAEGGGALPVPLSAGTTYYAIALSDSLFQVSTTLLGATGLVPATVGLSTAGSRILVVRSQNARIDAALEAASRHFDRYAPAHAVPLESPYPLGVTVLVAQLAAASLLLMSGKRSESIKEQADNARAELARMAKGIPVRDARAASATNLAVVGSAATTTQTIDSSYWPWSGSPGGYIP